MQLASALEGLSFDGLNQGNSHRDSIQSVVDRAAIYSSVMVTFVVIALIYLCLRTRLKRILLFIASCSGCVN